MRFDNMIIDEAGVERIEHLLWPFWFGVDRQVQAAHRYQDNASAQINDLMELISRCGAVFPHVCAAIQLSRTDKDSLPSKGDNIKYIYTDVQHSNPLCRVTPVKDIEKKNFRYDKEKYREMILDAAQSVLGYFGFDRTIYEDKKNTVSKKWRWLQEVRQQREKDIKTEMT
jgi:hypothetical protein